MGMIDPTSEMRLPSLAALSRISAHDGPWMVGLSECLACTEEDIACVPWTPTPNVFSLWFNCSNCGQTTARFVGVNEKAERLGRFAQPAIKQKPPEGLKQPQLDGLWHYLFGRRPRPKRPD